MLDVPPGNTTIEFAPPGGPVARLRMQNIPGNADVFLPALVIRKDAVVLADPAAVKVRVAMHVPKETPSGAFATIGGQRVPILNTPIAEMTDRHDYPTPPNGGVVFFRGQGLQSAPSAKLAPRVARALARAPVTAPPAQSAS